MILYLFLFVTISFMIIYLLFFKKFRIFNPELDVKFDDSNIDAFGRIRISFPYTLFQNTQINGIDNFQMDQKTNNSTITYISNDSSVDLSIDTAGSGNYAIYQSREYMSYQPGKSLLILITGVLNSGSNGDNARSRIGYFDDNDGVFYEFYQNKLYAVKRSSSTGSVIDTRVEQKKFNNRRELDLNLSKTQIFFFDIEWLGVGTVSCGFVREKQLIYTHYFHHDNIENTTYMKTSNLPVRYEIRSESVNKGLGTMKAICASVLSEGGFQVIGRPFVASSGTISVQTSETPLLAIRLKSDYKRTNVIVFGFHAGTQTNNPGGVHYRLRFYLAPTTDPTTGGTWASVDDNSFVESKIPTSLDTTNSAIIMSSYTSNRSNESEEHINEKKINLTFDIDGNYGDIAVLTGQALNSAVSLSSSLEWSELR